MKHPALHFLRPFRHAAWHAALITGLGCALPLLLGLFSGHPGFLWATLGAFLAALASPLHRLGMLSMLLLVLFGSVSVALGFWAAATPLYSLPLFAVYGLLLTWLQRHGDETGKLGLVLIVCLALGQGHYGLGTFNNPQAIAVLFVLGGLWVSLLGFGMRGVYGLRMWPYLPRLAHLLRIWRRNARQPRVPYWPLYGISCLLATGVSGFLVSALHLPHGYWLTLAVVTGLQPGIQRSVWRVLLANLGILALSALLISLGFSLDHSPLVGFAIIPLIMLCRAFQARHYALFAAQTTLLALLLSETLAQDWSEPQHRLTGAAIGTGASLLASLPAPLFHAYLRRRQRLLHSTEQHAAHP